MSAAIDAPTGKEAGRVTIVTTLTSFLPTILTCAIIVVAFLVGMLSAEIAGATLLTALGLGSAISGTVFTTAKHTPTDQQSVVFSSTMAGATGQTHPETFPTAVDDAPAGSHTVVEDDPSSPAADRLRSELEGR